MKDDRINRFEALFFRGSPPIGIRYQWIVAPFNQKEDPWFTLERIIGRYLIWRREDNDQLYESTHDGPLHEIDEI